MKKVPVAQDATTKSYYRFYERDMPEVPFEKRELLKSPFGARGDGLEISDRRRILEPGYLAGEVGIFDLEAGGFLIANKTPFPGSTGAMLQWWYAWHGIDPLRYAIWDNCDHYDLQVSDEARAFLRDPANPILSKCQGVTHHVKESLVPGKAPSTMLIRFEKFEDMGFSEGDVGTDRCSFLVIGNVEILTPPFMPNVPAVGLHTARDTEDGCELRSRFWVGYRIADGVPSCFAPSLLRLLKPALKPLLVNTLSHNFFEFNNLASILPEVYAQEKDAW